MDGSETTTTKWTPHLNKLSEVYDDGAEETQRLYAQGTQWLQVLCLLVEAVERMRECAEGGYASTEHLSVQGVLTRLTSTGLWRTLREVSDEFAEALENGGQGALEHYKAQISIRSIQFCLAHCEYRLQVVNQNALELAEHTHGRIFSTGWVIARKIGDSLRSPPPPAPQPIAIKKAEAKPSLPPPHVGPTPTTTSSTMKQEDPPRQKSEPRQERGGEVQIVDNEEEETKAAIKASLPHYMKRLPIQRPAEMECASLTNTRSGAASPPPGKRSSSPTRRSGPEPPSTLSLKEMRELLMGSDANNNNETQPMGRKSRQTRTVSPVRDDHPHVGSTQHVEAAPTHEVGNIAPVAITTAGLARGAIRPVRDASVTPEKTRARSEHYARSVSPTTRGGTHHDPATAGTSPGLLLASPQSKVVGRPRMTAAFEARMELLNKRKKDEARGKTSMLDLNSKRFAAVTSKVSSHRPAHEAPKTLAPPPRPRKEGRSLSPTARRGPPIQVDSAIGALRKQHRQATKEIQESPTRYRRNFVGKVPRYQPRSVYEQDDDEEESPAATRPPSPTPAPAPRPMAHEEVKEVSPPPRTPPPQEITPPPSSLGNVPSMLFPQPTTDAHVSSMSYFSTQPTQQQHNENQQPSSRPQSAAPPSIISRCILKNITTTLVHSNASRRDAPPPSTTITKPTTTMTANSNAANPLSYFTKR